LAISVVLKKALQPSQSDNEIDCLSMCGFNVSYRKTSVTVHSIRRYSASYLCCCIRPHLWAAIYVYRLIHMLIYLKITEKNAGISTIQY